MCSLSFDPAKTDPPLIIDTNAVSTLAVAFEGFETVSRNSLQIGERYRGVQSQQPCQRGLLDTAEAFHEYSREDVCCVF
jgi:hypothetical protein